LCIILGFFINLNYFLKEYKVAQRLEQTSLMINRFKQESRIVKPSQHVLDTLKNLMEQIDSSITGCKQSYMLQLSELDDEEKVLSKEVDVYDRKILAWASNSDHNNNHMNSGRPASSVNDKLTDSNLLKEVIDFDVSLFEIFVFLIINNYNQVSF
jgi:hypothetical protein